MGDYHVTKANVRIMREFLDEGMVVGGEESAAANILRQLLDYGACYRCPIISCSSSTYRRINSTLSTILGDC